MTSRTALILGGTGQIGRATALRLSQAGWRVTIAQRRSAPPPPGGESLLFDRDAPGALKAAVGKGVDAVVDTVAFDEAHARQLLELQQEVGAFVVISSASVYRDNQGRTLDEARVTGAPEFPVPIGEDQPTVLPGPETYSTRKVALEHVLQASCRRPLTLLRPGAIHGEGSAHAREWFFIKRVLDGRQVVPLAWSGASRFHTTASANLAELIRVALEGPGAGVINIGDPKALTVSEIGATIAQVYGAELRLLPLEGPPTRTVGGHPWCIPHPIVLDMTRAAALGYQPLTTYRAAMAQTCPAIEAQVQAGMAPPAYIAALFNYAAEDAWRAARGL